jgi:Zn-dependent protease with chaperone function
MPPGSSHRSAALVTREEARRRVILLSVSLLLLLSFGPVFGHHVTERLGRGLEGQDHLAALCLIALHELLAPVHYLFHLLIVAGLVYATFDRIRAAVRARRSLESLEIASPVDGDLFWSAAVEAGVDPGNIRVVAGLPSPAFTAGWLRPRIYVARALSDLGLPERAAVLAHEAAHVARRDPLRLSVLRFLACTLFWIPALRRLAADVADEAEVRADDEAAKAPLALASALLALSGWRQPVADLGDSVGFGQRSDLLERRIRRLAGEDPPVGSHVTRATLFGAFMALALVLSSGAIMAHPLPIDDASHRLLHCDHPDSWAGTHIACALARSPGEPCPHAVGA